MPETDSAPSNLRQRAAEWWQRNSTSQVGSSGRPMRVSTSLLAALALAALVLFVGSFVAGQYFQKDVGSSLSYTPYDGFCDINAGEGVGLHCFSDYQFLLMFTDQADPWAEVDGFHNNYFAAGQIPHAAFSLVGRAVGDPFVGLMAYLLAMAVCLAAPGYWASAGKPLWVRIVVVGLLGFAAPPALMALDRGNSVAFAVPALLMVLVGLRADRRTLLMAGMVLAVMVKPQFVLLLVVYIAARRWRELWRAGALVAGTNLAAFLLWPQSIPQGIFGAFTNALAYDAPGSLTWTYPTNSSLAKPVYGLEYVWLVLTGGELTDTWVDRNGTLVGAIVVLVIVAAVIALGRRVPPVIGAMLLMMGGSLMPGVSWMYYLVFSIPVAAVLLRDPIQGPGDQWRGLFDRVPGSLLHQLAFASIALAVVLSLGRIILGEGVKTLLRAGPSLWLTTSEIASTAWFVAACVVLVAGARGALSLDDAEPTPAAKAKVGA